MSNTKVVYIHYLYILTPVPTLYVYSSPICDQKHVFDLSEQTDQNCGVWSKIMIADRATDRQTHRQREHYGLSARLSMHTA